MNYHNAYPFHFLRSNKPYTLPHPKTINRQKEEDIYQNGLIRYRKNFAFCLISIVLGLVEPIICAALTGWRDLSEFTQNDKIIFSVFLEVLLATVIAMFVFAIKARKSFYTAEKALQAIALVTCYQSRYNDLPDDVTHIFFAFSQGYSIRAIVYRESNGWAYSIQSYLFFLPPHQGSFTTYDRCDGFPNVKTAIEHLLEHCSLPLEEDTTY